MNDTTIQQLKVLVERVVRPVRASIARKRKMREELLGHLASVFEEEARAGDEAAALTKTVERFGDTMELTRRLQASVPATDGFHYYLERFAGVPSHEPVVRRAGRYAGVVGLASGVFLIVFWATVGRNEDWFSLARLPSILTPFWVALLVFGATLIEQGMRHALFDVDGKRWPRIIAYATAAWLLVPGLVFAWYLAITGSFAASVLEVWPLFVSGLLGPVVLVIIVNAVIAEIRYLEEWASLKIE